MRWRQAHGRFGWACGSCGAQIPSGEWYALVSEADKIRCRACVDLMRGYCAWPVEESSEDVTGATERPWLKWTDAASYDRKAAQVGSE